MLCHAVRREYEQIVTLQRNLARLQGRQVGAHQSITQKELLVGASRLRSPQRSLDIADPVQIMTRACELIVARLKATPREAAANRGNAAAAP